VFHDLNRNGKRDAGEPGLSGVGVEIVVVGERKRFVVQSEEDGSFGFAMPVDKRYFLYIVTPSGWFVTTDISYFWLETEGDRHAEFGMVRPPLMSLALLILLGFLLAWLASAALDRRPSALRELAGELNTLSRLRLGHIGPGGQIKLSGD
jgi:hypothetical protein